MVVKGGKRNVSICEEFKTQGNSYFISLEYAKAIECYTRCIQAIDDKRDSKVKEPEAMKTIVLSNRAQAYLKLKAYNRAFEDADGALKLDPKHIKSLGRRGTASYYLGNIKEAQLDFFKTLELEPTNKLFLEYLKKTEEKLIKVKMEAYEKMSRRVIFTDLKEMGFDDHAAIVPVTEIHLDEQQNAQLQQKKEEVVQQQTKKNKKKRNKRKNKGLEDFMDDAKEMKNYEKHKAAEVEDEVIEEITTDGVREG